MVTLLLCWEKYWKVQKGEDGVVVTFVCQVGQAIMLSYSSEPNLDVAVKVICMGVTSTISWSSVEKFTPKTWVGLNKSVESLQKQNKSFLQKKKFCL